MSLRLLVLGWIPPGGGVADIVRFAPADLLPWPMGLFAVLFCLLTGATCSRVLDGTTAVLVKRAPAALLTGVGLAAGTGLLCALLALTGAGIIGVPVLIGATVVFALVGDAAVFRLIGRRLAPGLAVHPRGNLLATLLGILVWWTLTCVPAISLLATGLIFTAGLGAFALYLRELLNPSQRGRRRQERHDVKPLRRPPVTDPEVPRTAEPERVLPATLAIPRATFWPRLLANLIDFVVVYLLLYFLGVTRAFLPAWVLYRFAMYAWRSTTLGGIALGLDVIKADGSFLIGDYSTALVRALGSLLSLLPFGLGFFWILFDPEKNAWHDRLSRTFVVQMQLPRPRPATLPAQARAGGV